MNFKNKSLVSKERIKEIYLFLNKIKIDKLSITKIRLNESQCLSIINESLTHTSINLEINHERLEFLGDAVLRLVASEYIESNFPKLKVGDRSALRAQLVSDEWLSTLGKEINIKKFMLIGVKALKDPTATCTLQAEGTEAFIGALYECLKDLTPIQDWLSIYWNEKSKAILADPSRNNYKSALQEWSQSKGLKTPKYFTLEQSKEHGNSKRFFCEVLIEEEILGKGWGSSRKKAEKEAARIALGKLELSQTT